ncbi:uncharacterized protein LOC126367126 [Pectinophora gossypiella]|uniref:uncharacterized protein LOC126367126 n=1 Tax=Pectinophora gossypiella TaxID=13191 RepID=UPI00214E97DB|nr:uncharacterized protein LOC126367126 [Pectinophora gossypiella]
MHFTQALVLILTWTAAIFAKSTKKSIGKSLNNIGGGVELTGISRGTLLKVLSAFEEDINVRLKYRPVKPLFQAQFLNIRHSKPHIYPFLCDQGCPRLGSPTK